MKFNTKTIHGGQENTDPAYNSVMPPIYQTSTYAQSTPGGHKGFEYSRSGNPTRSALEKSLASIENGNYGLAFGSGLAAIDAILKLLKPGDEVLSTNDLYGGTHRLFTGIFKDFGIKFNFIGMQNAEAIEKHISDKTKIIWIESPTNPMMSIINIEAVAKVAKKHKVLLGVDNTFATPYLQQPLDLGADIVMHSATKYLGGHSDVVMGALVVKENECPKVEISYLTAQGKAPISEKINRANEEYIINIFNSTPDPSEAKTIKEAAKLFMDDYFQYRNEFPEARADYEAEISQEQLVKTDSLLTYKTKFYLFTGGAHGYGATRFLNFNLKNGERLKNSQLFKDEEGFTKYAETKFREKFNIPTGESINKNGFFFNEDKFQLSENIAITKDEVLLIYNPYEAASYAEGQLELIIAKSEVEEFLNY